MCFKCFIFVIGFIVLFNNWFCYIMIFKLEDRKFVLIDRFLYLEFLILRSCGKGIKIFSFKCIGLDLNDREYFLR